MHKILWQIKFNARKLYLLYLYLLSLPVMITHGKFYFKNYAFNVCSNNFNDF